MNNTQTAAVLQTIIPHFHKLLKNERNLFFKSFKITPTQYDVLSSLQHKSLNLSALSDLVGLDSSTLVGIVDRLEKRGLLNKRVSPADRRKNIISVTEKGRKALQAVPVFISPSIRAVLDEIDPADRENLARILNGLLGRMEEVDLSIILKTDTIPLQPASVL